MRIIRHPPSTECVLALMCLLALRLMACSGGSVPDDSTGDECECASGQICNDSGVCVPEENCDSSVDTDSDGTPDCEDGCPEDDEKMAPGACGCGAVDEDADSDGTPDCLQGVPDPQQLTGTVAEGESIMITGTGFGEGPTVSVFDNFEGGSDGEEVDPESPTLGSWFAISEQPRYLDLGDGARSGTKVVLVADSGRAQQIVAGLPAEEGDETFHDGLKAFQEVFYRYSVKDLENFPGSGGGPESFSDDSSTKDSWLMLGFQGYSEEENDGQGNDLYIPAWAGSFAISGNNAPKSYWFDLDEIWDFGGWTVMSFYARLDSSDPHGDVAASYFQYFSDRGFRREDIDGPLIADEPGGVPPYWDRINIPGWYRDSDNFRRVMDDMYVAIGPHAQARVELGNASTYSACTKFALLTPSSWTNDEIQATVRSGGFSDLGSLYLYVFNGNGGVNPVGLAIP